MVVVIIVSVLRNLLSVLIDLRFIISVMLLRLSVSLSVWIWLICLFGLISGVKSVMNSDVGEISIVVSLFGMMCLLNVISRNGKVIVVRLRISVYFGLIFDGRLVLVVRSAMSSMFDVSRQWKEMIVFVEKLLSVYLINR